MAVGTAPARDSGTSPDRPGKRRIPSRNTPLPAVLARGLHTAPVLGREPDHGVVQDPLSKPQRVGGAGNLRARRGRPRRGDPRRDRFVAQLDARADQAGGDERPGEAAPLWDSARQRHSGMRPATAITLFTIGVCPAGLTGEPARRLLLAGIATTYEPGDGSSGQPVGCIAAAVRDHGTANLSDLLARGVPVVATRYKTRTRPRCGERVVVELVKSGRRTEAVKYDVGPWGMCVPRHGTAPQAAFRRCPKGAVRVVASPPDPYQHRQEAAGSWISTVDLTPPVCKALGGCSGWDQVRIWSVP